MFENGGKYSDTTNHMVYRILIKGHLDEQWSVWFENTVIELTADGNTLLTCQVIDQANLHGLLKKVRDLGMILLTVDQISPGIPNKGGKT